MAETQLAVEFLLTLTIDGITPSEFDFDAPLGARVFGKASGGTVKGPKFNGKVLPLLATDYGRANADRSIRELEADISLQAEDGTVVLAQYRGRMSPAYGPGQSRVRIMFKVADGPHDWLQKRQAIGFGEEKDGKLIVQVYAVVFADPVEGPAEAFATPADRTSVPAEFVLRRKSEHTSSDRHIVPSRLGMRYFTLAEGGGAFSGPRVGGEFVSGYSWSPHYLSRQENDSLAHFDVKTLLRANDGTPILMNYTGASSSAYPTGCWITSVLFETPEGPHGWLNEVLAVGIGRWAGDGAEYHVYALR